jgi:hypothetical protein
MRLRELEGWVSQANGKEIFSCSDGLIHADKPSDKVRGSTTALKLGHFHFFAVRPRW